MGRDPLKAINPRAGTAQKEKAREDQVKNSAGGYVFRTDDYTRLNRFLMLGTDGGTYYVKEAELTKDNAKFIIDLAGKHGTDMVQQILQVSTEGRAPRQNPTLFALAAVSVYGNDAARSMAYSVLSKVARTGSMLFQFITYREQLGGWSRGLRTAVANWYNSKDADKLAYQMVKYRTRNNWSHRDVLRMAHPVTTDEQHAQLYEWAVGKPVEFSDSYPPVLIQTFESLQKATSVDEVVALIGDDGQVSWEMIPDRFMNSPEVWEALFNSGIPQRALIRQLPRLTRIGVVNPHGGITNLVANQIQDSNILQKARVHPINVLIAQKTYESGAGKGSTWTPVPKIIDALDIAFYNAFKAVEPTGKRIMLAVDVSGSMGFESISNLNMTPREAAGALTLVTAATEPNSFIVGFSDGHRSPGNQDGRFIGYQNYGRRRDALVTPLSISPRQRLDDVVRYMRELNFGATDLALPMLYALENNISVDAFVVYTDNETWYGDIHPYQALQKYRHKTGIPAKLVVVSMTATPFSIADPLDEGMLDVVGFDANVVSLINEFIRS